MTYTIVYNLSEYIGGIFLPSAYIVETDAGHTITYYKTKATEGNLSQWQLELSSTVKKLLDLIGVLSPQNLESRFNKGNKKPLPLTALLDTQTQDRQVIQNITYYINNKLNEWLNIIVEHQLPLCLDIENKAVAHLAQLRLNPTVLQPDIYFEHVPDGLIYRLRIREGDKLWQLQNQLYILVCNEPAWIIKERQLYRLEGINSGRLKPFFIKEEVHIPQKNLKTYYKTIILPLVEKVDFSYKGFDIVPHDVIVKAALNFVYNFLNQSYGLMLSFDYERERFGWKESRQHKSFLEISPDEKLIIHHVKRNITAEKYFIEQLQNLGLINRESIYFEIEKSATTTCEALIDWLITHQDFLEKQGFEVIKPVIAEKKICLVRPVIKNFSKAQQNDWFDISCEIEVGDYTIPFSKLVMNIRQNDPFFMLPNGEYFIIPTEWMEKFKGLAQMGKVHQNAVRILRSQAPALLAPDIPIENPIATEDIEWTPSPYLKANLRPYQEEGVKWLLKHYKNSMGACLADDMGLGKTVQTLAVLLYAKENKKIHSMAASGVQMDMFERFVSNNNSKGTSEASNPLLPLQSLIILPASLVYNWYSEIKKFTSGLLVYMHVGAKRHKDLRLIQNNDIVLTTYQTVSRDIDLLEKMTWEYVILDESQYIKNKNSDTFKAVCRLKAAHKISLSGTPIENSLSELWSQMQFINPHVLGSYAFFDRDFIKPIEKNQDATQKEQLKNLIKPYLLRRTKNEVARDLPDLSSYTIYSEMGEEQRKVYEKEKSAVRNLLLGGTYASKSTFEYNNIVAQSLNRLRLLAIHPALVLEDYEGVSAKFTDVLTKWEETRLSGYKMLIFSFFVKNLMLYRHFFDKNNHLYRILTGDKTLDERNQAVADFSRDENIKTFLISLKAGGTGLNLTAADYVFILDPWWNPAAEKQAVSRAHRIGQTKPVVSLKFITKNTIEEKILQLQERKTQLVQDIIEEASLMRVSKHELAFLLE